jgi:negative regulator of flagellin synthesis FlgM
VKINDSLKKTAGLTTGTTTANVGKSAEKSEAVETSQATQTSSVNVQLSSQAQTLASQVASASVFDANKVEEIKSAIASGTFKVDAEKVAEGLIDTVRDLIQNRKG